MTARDTNMKRDAVLFAFHQECERPTALQIIEWTERYPEFADDIRAHAAVRLDEAPGSEHNGLEPDEILLARGRSRALNAIYIAKQKVAAERNAASASWQHILDARNISVPQLARKIDIDRMVLAELSAGRMRPPLGFRLVDALTDALDITSACLETAVNQLISAPRIGHAKSDRAPQILSRSYEEIVIASPMPDDRKQYWLGKD